jgi:hypothetical protein
MARTWAGKNPAQMADYSLQYFILQKVQKRENARIIRIRIFLRISENAAFSYGSGTENAYI